MSKSKTIKMQGPTQLEGAELGKLQGLINDFNKIKMQLGETFLTQQSLLSNMDKLREQYRAEEKILADKYGEDCVINIQTGAISKKPKEEATT